ncbi:transcription repressor OFP16 [Sesamum indicum]|uniref:Transcription repressor n=1 Tax=Sesamum indicum TaxID=4182 RepID=A0A6I9TGT4_SESIN|nr:transcription repressor OFP16 [Sesamum indicum]
MARNLNSCFTKIKSLSSPEHTVPENHGRPFSNPSPSLLIKNFNSLYDSFNAASDHHSTSESDTESPATTPDFATAFASQRFFFSSPGRSNSIVDSAAASIASTSSSSTSLNQHGNDTVSGDSIAVPTYSPDPFLDFRRSMQEMVEAREIHDVRENWDYLHELLMCYLSLNPKSTHKYIVGAFADLLVSLIASSPEKGGRRTPSPAGKCKISRKCV